MPYFATLQFLTRLLIFHFGFLFFTFFFACFLKSYFLYNFSPLRPHKRSKQFPQMRGKDRRLEKKVLRWPKFSVSIWLLLFSNSDWNPIIIFFSAFGLLWSALSRIGDFRGSWNWVGFQRYLPAITLHISHSLSQMSRNFDFPLHLVGQRDSVEKVVPFHSQILSLWNPHFLWESLSELSDCIWRCPQHPDMLRNDHVVF